MNRLEQRCEGVRRALEDYKIKYMYKYEDKRLLKICNTKYDIEISNKYITVRYSKKGYTYFLPSFTGIIEFRNFLEKNGTNFMELKKGE